MTLWITFAILFIGGPLLFRQLLRLRLAQRVLGRLAGAMILVAMALRYGLADLWERDLRVTVAGLFLIWLGWILVLAFGAQALRQASPGLRMRRWTSVMGAAGTTVPWFGIASASWIEG